jgi:hypothetical protein
VDGQVSDANCGYEYLESVLGFWEFFLEQYRRMAISNISELDLVKPDYGKFVPAPTFIVETLENATKKEGGSV